MISVSDGVRDALLRHFNRVLHARIRTIMQVPEFIQGSIAPVFTAFNEDGTLDDAGQRNLMDYLLEAGGVSAYFIRCGMGQMFTFDMDDTKQLAKNVCEHMAGKGPVLLGCSGIWDRNYEKRPDPDVFLKQAIELTQYAEEVGASGAVHSIPEALVPAEGQSMDDFNVEYFSTVCAATKLPVFIYQTPGTLPEYSVTRNSLAQIADIDTMAGIKVSTADGAFIFDMCQAVKGKDFAYIVGAETAFYAGMMAGSRACIGQGATMNPKTINAIRDRYLAGDVQGAVQAQYDTNMLVYECPNPVDFFKMYVTEKGYPVGTYARGMGGSPYVKERKELAPDQYEAFKKYYEATVENYG